MCFAPPGLSCLQSRRLLPDVIGTDDSYAQVLRVGDGKAEVQFATVVVLSSPEANMLQLLDEVCLYVEHAFGSDAAAQYIWVEVFSLQCKPVRSALLFTKSVTLLWRYAWAVERTSHVPELRPSCAIVGGASRCAPRTVCAFWRCLTSVTVCAGADAASPAADVVMGLHIAGPWCIHP